jgi:hypothetical protein
MPMDLPPRRRPEPAPSGRFERATLAVFMGVIVAGFAAVVITDFTPAKLSVPFFLLARLPLIAVHEAGHALVGHLLGWRIERVVVGYGGAAWRFVVRGVPVQIGRLPLGGHVRLAPEHPGGLRWRAVAILLAGVGAELVVLALLAALVGPARLLAPSASIAVIAAQAVGVAILVDAVANWLPLAQRRSDVGDDWSPSDGLAVVQTLLASRDELRRAYAAPLREAEARRRR